MKKALPTRDGSHHRPLGNPQYFLHFQPTQDLGYFLFMNFLQACMLMSYNTYALKVILFSDLQTAPVFPLYKAREGSQGQSSSPTVENVPLAQGGPEDTWLSLSELLDAQVSHPRNLSGWQNLEVAEVQSRAGCGNRWDWGWEKKEGRNQKYHETKQMEAHLLRNWQLHPKEYEQNPSAM